METTLIKINAEKFSDEELLYPVTLLQKGELVAFPTETVYGLGANALSGEACKKIYIAKQRPQDNPLIVHISNMEMLRELVSDIPPFVDVLTKQFWPGPLTILFPKSKLVPDEVTCGLNTVAIRMPSHPIAKRLIELSGVPIAAPSANLSGRPSGTTGEDVLSDLKGRILNVIDSGPATAGLESTVIDLQRNPPTILRPGAITLETIAKFIPNVVFFSIPKKKDNSISDNNNTDNDNQLNEPTIEDEILAHPPTPGLKYRHYSPNTKVVLFDFDINSVSDYPAIVKRMQAKIHEFIHNFIKNDNTIGIMHVYSTISYKEFDAQKDLITIYPLGDENHIDEVGQKLFKALRDLEHNVDVIIVEGVREIEIGTTIMNRIRKAASEIITVR